MKKLLDLKLFGLVAILIVALVFIGVDFIEGQVTTLGKPDKLDKPSKPDTEWIEFTGDSGDLVGGAAVVGCCPNAGPWPDYQMTLGFDVGGFPAGIPIDGQLFINYYGAGRNQKYKVQFWWNYDLDLGIEIIGGVIDYDKRDKVLTVTFTNEDCVLIKSGTFIKLVNFTLIRHPI